VLGKDVLGLYVAEGPAEGVLELRRLLLCEMAYKLACGIGGPTMLVLCLIRLQKKQSMWCA